ncbi:looped-hinge helix DNA binding domain, AbrB family [Terriglobus roseus DSM 18391]|uniref:Looped-hinge helix DNA binding domain, AbrB family n=1 Tax=Terriglobus roseus (strain DSM 18391 / NRRL B-41598 / KBS 63) TaxID=926566 RepID=I3ZEG7_TERRK|nr:AbrB/MazE/SpoVT family DNA-binding domain-containing protein [Terriglobus roseus]AFL87635.1 looped-hinge helix DNA binding domain, AbrB family [Terriglobus roseus DSM 18391]
MKLAAKVGERGQVVIPKAIREELAIGKDSAVEFELKGKVLTLRPKKNLEKIRKALAQYKGSQTGALRADGFASVDEYMRVIRSR